MGDTKFRHLRFCSLSRPSVFSVITFSLVWFHFLCSPVPPEDPGGWQSHPVQPARLLETEQPSSLHWTHRQTRNHKTTQVQYVETQRRGQGWGGRRGEDTRVPTRKTRTNRQWRQHTQHTFILCTKREWERGGRPLSGIYNVFILTSLFTASQPKPACISCNCTELMNIIKPFKCKQELYWHEKHWNLQFYFMHRLNNFKYH